MLKSGPDAMNIVAFTSSAGYSGGVRQAIYQTAGLRALGHEAVLCLPHDSWLWTQTAPAPWWVRLPPDERAWKPVLESLCGSGPSVVHAFHNRAVKLAAWWGLRWQRRGVVCVAHRGITTRPKNPLPYWSPGIRLFLVNSAACGRSLGWYCPSWRIRVVPNGVPDERVIPCRPSAEVRAELRLDEGALVLGYIGNDNPLKGTDELMRAFAMARGMAETAVLVMVGVHPERWNAAAAELGVAERVRVVAQSAHVSDILQVCDGFIFPSRGMDSAPNVLLEAVRMGLPVVSTDVGGCPDIVDGNGLLVPAGKVKALAKGISALCANAERRATWAARSREVGAKFTVEARCRILESIYAELLSAMR